MANLLDHLLRAPRSRRPRAAALFQKNTAALLLLFALLLLSFLAGDCSAAAPCSSASPSQRGSSRRRRGCPTASGGGAHRRPARRRARSSMRTAPLTARLRPPGGFFHLHRRGGLRARHRPPFGEAEVVGGAFALPDDQMLLGGDQLAATSFSRLIYGGRNTVRRRHRWTIHARLFFLGTVAGLVGPRPWAAGSTS